MRKTATAAPRKAKLPRPLPELEVPPAGDAVTARDPETMAAVRAAVDAALDKKAEDMKVLEVGAVTTFTDYFLLCNGQNTKQVQAIADGVEESLRRGKRRALHVEGYNSGNWVLLDYGDFVLHVFLHEKRRFYGLERLWSDAPDVTASFAGAAGGADALAPPPA